MVDSQAGAPAYGIGAGEGCAPGRLDFIGGVSDYSGAVVLQAAISLETRVKIEYIHDDLGLRERRMIEVRSEQFGDNEPVALDLNEIENCAKRGLSQVKTYLAVQDSPKWASYVIGTLCAFCNHKQCWPQQGSIRISVDSDVPHGEGVSSSAALEIAVLRALEDHFNLFTPKEDLPGLAELAQQAENEVVGAPCGIMDQITCLCGSHGAVLPIDCAARTMSEEIFLPSGVFIVGFPTKVQHTLTGHPPGTSPYERARTATAMAAKIVQAEVLPALKTLTDISTVSLPKFDKEIKPKLPASMKGRDFLAKYGSIEEVDAMSVVVPGEEYPLLDAMEFAVQGPSSPRLSCPSSRPRPLRKGRSGRPIWSSLAKSWSCSTSPTPRQVWATCSPTPLSTSSCPLVRRRASTAQEPAEPGREESFACSATKRQ